MKTRIILCMLSFGLGLCSTTPLHADLISQFTFDGSSPGSSDGSTNWETSDLANGPGVPLTISTVQGNPAPTIQISFADIDNGNLDGALTAGDYYAFTVTPDPGFELTFTDLTFDSFKTSNAGATISATLFSSIDGFANAGNAIGNGQLVGTGDSGVYRNRTISLAALPTVSTATEFRIYIDDGNASNNANQYRLDNLVLNGTAQAIPEPSTLVLTLLGLGTLFARRSTHWPTY